MGDRTQMFHIFLLSFPWVLNPAAKQRPEEQFHSNSDIL